jgi:hypothetical protein
VESSLWSDVAAIYRRICLLRLRGQSLEASRLQSTELSRAISSLRETVGSASECDSRLEGLFAREEERVTNASVLAEVLLPLLRDSVSAVVARPPLAGRARSTSAAGSSSRAQPASAPGIADFIDEMIQLERPAPSAGAQ